VYINAGDALGVFKSPDGGTIAVYAIEEVPEKLPSKFMTAYVNVTVDNMEVGERTLTADAVDKSYADIVALVLAGSQVGVKLRDATTQSLMFLPLCEYYQGNWASFSTLLGGFGVPEVVSIQMTADGEIRFQVKRLGA
jgi:hypothetical protein